MNLPNPESQEPAARSEHETSPQTLCLNCNSPLTGPFCAQCGQRRGPAVMSTREWLRQAADDLVSLDYKLPRTLWQLIRQPGHVTREYLRGRRERFTRPIRLYIVISAISIAAMSTIGVMDLSNLLKDTSSEDLELLEQMFGIEDASNPVFLERFNRRVNTVFPILNLVSPLAFAIVLKLLYWRRHLHEHLVLSFHFTTVMVAVSSILVIPMPSVLLVAGLVALAVGCCGYLVLALARVYGTRGAHLAVRTGLLMIGVVIVTQLISAATFMIVLSNL